MSSGLPRCIRCDSTNTQTATVLGSQPHERWYRCEYCKRFFAVRIEGEISNDELVGARVPVSATSTYAARARLILADK